MPLWKAVRCLWKRLTSRSSWRVELSPQFDEALQRLEKRFAEYPEALKALKEVLRDLVRSLEKRGDHPHLAPERLNKGLPPKWELLKYRGKLRAPVPDPSDRYVRVILIRDRERRWIYLWMPYTHFDFKSRPQDSSIKNFLEGARQNSLGGRLEKDPFRGPQDEA